MGKLRRDTSLYALTGCPFALLFASGYLAGRFIQLL